MFALFIAACSLAEAARLENHATNALETLDLDRTLWKKRDKAEAILALIWAWLLAKFLRFMVICVSGLHKRYILPI